MVGRVEELGETLQIIARVGPILAALSVLLSPPARAQPPVAPVRIADLRVSSAADATDIVVGIPSTVPYQDRTRTRPGGVAVDEIRLFFPGVSLQRSRLITVGDPIVEEARLFSEPGGVTMTVVVRRPVHYAVNREEKMLRIRAEPGVLLAEGAPGAEAPGAGVAPKTIAPPTIVGVAPQRGQRGGAAGTGGLQGQVLAPKVAIPKAKPGEGLSVDADHITYDQERNQVVAQGRVTIAKAGSLLTADEVRVNRDTNEADATGHVQLSDPQGTIRSDRFHVNLDDETGTLARGNVYLNASHMSISGSRFEKSYGQTYHIENGEFTTCECGVGAPSWSIAGKQIDIALDGYGLVRNGTFRVLDVPILYLPYMPFPAKTTRQSGLLAPIFGFSRKRGFEYLQPLYLVINKSSDATLSADVETSARVGTIAEYRYALDSKSRGVIDLSYFNESLRSNADRDIVDPNVADPHIPKDRWSETATLKQDLPYGFSGFADSLAVSDDFFLREIPTFSFDPEYDIYLRTLRYTQSRVGLYRGWDKVTLIGQGQYFQDFFQEHDLTLQRLPDVSVYASDRFFDRFVKLAFTGEGVNFQRRKGFDGPRIDLLPQALVPFRWQEYFRGNAGIGFRETAYHLNNTALLLPQSQTGGLQDVAAQKIPALSKNPTRELLQATAQVGTEIHRIFDVRGENVAKLKHTIEPKAQYLYIPDVKQDDLPTYDFTDRINGRNLFTYGVTSRLLARLRTAPTAAQTRPMTAADVALGGITPAPFSDDRVRGYGTTGPAPMGSEAAASPGASGSTPTGATENLADLTPEARAEMQQADQDATSHVVEWARLDVQQSYDVDHLVQKTQQNRKGRFSDVDVALRLTPSDYAGLLFGSSFDPKTSSLDQSQASVILKDPRERVPGVFLQSSRRASLSLSYRYIAGSTLQEVDGGILLPLADSLSLFELSRYDALNRTFLENRGGFTLTSQCQCWILDLFVANRVNPNETEVRTQVTLVGLGSVGRNR